MSKFYKTKDFQNLQKEWTKKLEESGFEDIESSEDNLKIWSTRFANRHKDPVLWQAKEAYYRMAEQFLASYHFANELDKVIWEYHSNALSIKNITILLLKVNIVTNRTTVWQTIKRLEQVMKDMLISDDEDCTYEN